jgi:hypothetical protein
MNAQTCEKITYDLNSITRKVPPSPGVYSVYSRNECVYVAESDDVCASLLELYFEDNPSLNEKELTHFTFDLVASELRGARQNDRNRNFGWAGKGAGSAD